MSDKTSVSNVESYQGIGDYWDEHDSTEFGEEKEVGFDLQIHSQRRYFPLDSKLFLKIRKIAENHGVSEETLLNLWIQEKVNQNQGII